MTELWEKDWERGKESGLWRHKKTGVVYKINPNGILRRYPTEPRTTSLMDEQALELSKIHNWYAEEFVALQNRILESSDGVNEIQERSKHEPDKPIDADGEDLSD